MFAVELYARIRRAVMVEGLSRREVAKRFGVHRNTITKMLQFSVPPGYRRRERPASKKLGPFMAWIDAVLEGDRSVHKKQRHTAHRIFERLRSEEGFSGRTAKPLSVRGELCGILGDGVNQAADFFSDATSIPSRNVTPLTTFGN
jgi:transposase